MSINEIRNLVIAWIIITFAFAWRGPNINTLNILPIILLGTLTGFILHELAHKFVAIKYGASAEFMIWPTGLIFAVVMSLLTFGSFVFAAPGAVYISGNINYKQNGIISIAGPITNLIAAIIFSIIGMIVDGQYLSMLFTNVAHINWFLGLFNMIPVMPLDGSKVFVWNKWIWTGTIISFILVIIFI